MSLRSLWERFLLCQLIGSLLLLLEKLIGAITAHCQEDEWKQDFMLTCQFVAGTWVSVDENRFWRKRRVRQINGSCYWVAASCFHLCWFTVTCSMAQSSSCGWFSFSDDATDGPAARFIHLIGSVCFKQHVSGSIHYKDVSHLYSGPEHCLSLFRTVLFLTTCRVIHLLMWILCNYLFDHWADFLLS